jgi:hypothetical protein
MNNQIIIFSAYEPDKNSGGNSMIPHIIKTINKMYLHPVVYFHIQFAYKKFDNPHKEYLEMCKYEEEYLPIAKVYMLNNKNNIVIYAELSENILQFNNIVRFNFYFNMITPSNNNEYTIFFASPFERLFNKVRTMYNIPNYEIDKKNIFPKYINYFYNTEKLLKICCDKGRERHGSCYTIRKGVVHPHIREAIDYIKTDAFNIPHELSNPDDLVEIFNKYKYFYSYDGFTNMLQMAALCGCIPIIVPFSNFNSIEEFWEEKWFTNGIAYGDSETQILHAINTRHIMIDELKNKEKENFTELFKELTESIFSFFNKEENNGLDKILVNNTCNKNDIILVYKLKYNENNNKILILTNKCKLNLSNIIAEGFDITSIEDIDNEDNINILDSRKYNYLFTDSAITNINYRLETHFYLKFGENDDKYAFKPYNYIPQKIINNKPLQTYINLNINFNLSIPPYIYDYRPNYGKSTLIWSPSQDNFSNNHWIINIINSIGFSYYKRSTNLIKVLNWNNSELVAQKSNIINNPLNICIYQESGSNPLNMEKVCHINWFFDPRFRQEFSNNTLFIDQFPLYHTKRNIFRQKYGYPIDINSFNSYPNCFPIVFNSDRFLEIAKSEEINKYKRDNSCFVLRKTQDSHSLKMMDSISKYFIHPENCLNIDGLNIDDSISIFLRCHTFYCYDLVTFLPVIACLCGCKVIIISDYPGFKDMRDIYKVFNPWMYCGMTYYINNEFIEPPENGREDLINLLTAISNNSYKNFSNELSSYNNLLTFLQYLETYFNVTFVE